MTLLANLTKSFTLSTPIQAISVLRQQIGPIKNSKNPKKAIALERTRSLEQVRAVRIYR